MFESALRRYWWIMVIGLILASVIAVLVVYRVDSIVPLKLSERSTPTYTATSRLLVTSAENPYIRVSVTQIIERPLRAPLEGETEPPTYATPVTEAPDIAPLVTAANLYPLIIESDQVAALREEMFGSLPGSVTARGIYAIVTPARYEPSIIPVVEVTGTADSRQESVDITQHTTEAFLTLLQTQQSDAELKPKEIIRVEQLNVPTDPTAEGGTNPALPIVAAVGVLLGFFGLAVLLDKRRAKPVAERENVAEREQVRDVPASETA